MPSGIVVTEKVEVTKIIKLQHDQDIRGRNFDSVRTKLPHTDSCNWCRQLRDRIQSRTGKRPR